MHSLYWTSRRQGTRLEDTPQPQQPQTPPSKQQDSPFIILDDNPSMPPSLNIEVVGNHIYFYNFIDNDTILRLNRALRETSNRIMAHALNNDVENPNITLHINSGGGEIFSGFAGADAILDTKIPVTTIVDGYAASAATILSVVGSKRLIGKHAYMLIHQLSTTFWGKHEEFKDQMENLDKFMVTIRNFYKEYTKIPTNKINQILKHDLYFSAEECVRFGLVDAIYKG